MAKYIKVGVIIGVIWGLISSFFVLSESSMFKAFTYFTYKASIAQWFAYFPGMLSASLIDREILGFRLDIYFIASTVLIGVLISIFISYLLGNLKSNIVNKYKIIGAFWGFISLFGVISGIALSNTNDGVIKAAGLEFGFRIWEGVIFFPSLLSLPLLKLSYAMSVKNLDSIAIIIFLAAFVSPFIIGVLAVDKGVYLYKKFLK